jgi:hypothetical protein
MQTITKMAPSNSIEQLSQMHDEFEIIGEAQSITEDMRKAYENHGEAMDDEQLLTVIQMLELDRFLEYAAEIRSTHPEETDTFMMSKGFTWGNREDGDIGYLC